MSFGRPSTNLVPAAQPPSSVILLFALEEFALWVWDEEGIRGDLDLDGLALGPWKYDVEDEGAECRREWDAERGRAFDEGLGRVGVVSVFSIMGSISP